MTKKIVSILKYLNLHLSERQSIDSLSRQFYISKYYMMRRFEAKPATPFTGISQRSGCSWLGRESGQGEALGQVSEACGFQDYSTFSRAYKKRFGASPNAPIPEARSLVPAEPLD